MTLHVRDAGGSSAIAYARVRDAGGLSDLGYIRVQDAGGVNVVFSAFGGDSGLIASPTIVYGSTNSHAFQRINTGSTTVTVSPAGPVDSVGWAFDDTGWDAINPTSLTTAFRSPPVGPGDTAIVFATCTVTRGGVPASVDVTAQCSNFGS